MQRPQNENRPIIIGTRGSPLALWQAYHVQGLICERHGWPKTRVPVQIFKTSGDKLKGALSEFGGKGLFTKELEEALLGGTIDIAVHSMKDVPTVSQEGLEIAAILEREDPRDAFISPKISNLLDLPKGASVGTASLRRRAQLARLRPDIEFTLLRGNVGTRLEKLKNGDCDATFLAVAGLNRLEQADVITQHIEADVMLSAPAQGAIGIELRSDNGFAMDVIKPLDHQDTRLAITAERAFLTALDGSCRTPIAALATLSGETMSFRGELIAPDGSLTFMRSTEAAVTTFDDAYAVGYVLGMEIRSEADGRIQWDEV